MKINRKVLEERRRSRDYLAFIHTKTCLVCGRGPIHAHHLQRVPGQPRALGLKTGDQWAIPICPDHHRAIHSFGDEETWWALNGVDPLAEAKRLQKEYLDFSGKEA